MSKQFYKIRDKLEAEGKTFGATELRQLSFADLFLAGIGNAGKAICQDRGLIDAEEERRLSRFDSLSFAQLEESEFEDQFEKYAAFKRLADRQGISLEQTLPVQLYRAMRALRGDWSDHRESPHLKRIYSLLDECVKAGTLPQGFLLAVKHNADTFDGHFNDGRIMRDGQLLLDEHIAKEFHLPRTQDDPKGFVSASGNIARMMGAQPIKRGEWYGSYEELWEQLLKPEEKAAALLGEDD